MNVPPGTYQIVTSHRLTADQAADNIFPESASVVLVDTEVVGATVVYTYMVDYIEGVAA